MVKLERVKLSVQQAFSEQRTLIGLDEEGQSVMAKGSFCHVYPMETVYLYGEFKNSPFYGRYFEIHHIREILDVYWVSKWMKLFYSFSHDEIADMVIDGTYPPEVKEKIGNMKKGYMMISAVMKLKKSVQQWLSVEGDYRFQWDQIAQNPYLLLDYPFITLQDVERVAEGGNGKEYKTTYLVRQALKKAYHQGHYYLPEANLEKILTRYGAALSMCLEDERIQRENGKWYLREYYDTEKAIARSILFRIHRTCENGNSEEMDGRISEWESRTGMTLAPNQRKAVKMALSDFFCVVTGGPGVGKTTVCKCITDLLGEEHCIVMVAPTGRAAKRANESTGLPTSTIHSLLGYNGYRFFRNEENPIETDVLVIDESSMIDAPLLKALLAAVPEKTKIIFVGDVDQLPSVGPGQILKDLIESGNVPVTKLTDIFRQAAGSPIITLAYAINEGKIPELVPHEELEPLEKKEELDVFYGVIELAEELYRAHDPFEVQVLIPVYEGPVGINTVNRALQKRLHPGKQKVGFEHAAFVCGDKVIQTENVKSKGIYNGDIGVVSKVGEGYLEIQFQGKKEVIRFEGTECGQLQLSYATSVHRSQGSEYPYVIVPLVNSYGIMLQKNLLYTAVTRAKTKLWLYYQKEALEQAVRLDSVPNRYTSLKEMLYLPPA